MEQAEGERRRQRGTAQQHGHGPAADRAAHRLEEPAPGRPRLLAVGGYQRPEHPPPEQYQRRGHGVATGQPLLEPGHLGGVGARREVVDGRVPLGAVELAREGDGDEEHSSTQPARTAQGSERRRFPAGRGGR
ncbi:hypothetical protein [Streptomyces sp. S465]|uniref:hypothetical protein n=1 Tax=Streptomyces sp. S465 TaxID=2979468 RepID=UPI003FCE566F